MEETSKKLRAGVETEDVRSHKNTLSPFNKQDLTIKIGDKEIFVKKDDLIEVSPVFQTMLTANFKEKDAQQIELPDKDPTTFALFLRHTLPGFDGLELQEATANLILPLAHEYQTNTTLSKIDKVLAACVEGREYKCGENLTNEILTAEFYNLQQYVKACINKASAFSHKPFIKNPKFHDISGDTKSEIFLNMCKEMEDLIQENEVRISQCVQSLEEHSKRSGCFNCQSGTKFRESFDKLNVISKSISEVTNRKKSLM
ncbi:Hypothetical predicted protein [Mytilus galloprovincialis]|uniref:BTB domain-containing protein n=1 Tax=Mytilus galloprovincialis TaxID=29158 RepID=A0A8B6FBL3_MYTGA|nr:Hypothetical predicted protein [Mytilus galloprovincialis]